MEAAGTADALGVRKNTSYFLMMRGARLFILKICPDHSKIFVKLF